MFILRHSTCLATALVDAVLQPINCLPALPPCITSLYCPPVLHPQEDEATQSLVQRHLLRGTATDALDSLLSWSQLEFGEDDLSAAAAGEPTTSDPGSSSWTPATRSKLVKSLPAEVGQPLAKALEAAGGVDAQVRLEKRLYGQQPAGTAVALRLRARQLWPCLATYSEHLQHVWSERGRGQ